MTFKVKHYYFYPGSEGKLALTSQRCGMMLGVGYFSYNGVGGGQSMQQLASQVTEQFIPVLQQEGLYYTDYFPLDIKRCIFIGFACCG